jgi:hypothetical protein
MSRILPGRRRTVRSRPRSRALEILEPRTLLAASWNSYARDAQHSAQAPVAAQNLQAIHWQTPVDLQPQYSGSDLLIHYGSPIITAANTVIVPVKTGATDGFKIDAHNGADGTLLWSRTTDYTLPPHGGAWTPSYDPALTPSGRLYYAGAGGTVYYVDQPDATDPGTPAQTAFYDFSQYTHAGFDSSVYISTPLTVDSQGNIYFGYQVSGPNPLNLQSGIARIGSDGKGTYVAATTAANDSSIVKVVDNCAPALSNDGKTLYIAVSTGDFGHGYLLALDSTTLATAGKTHLIDPSTNSDAALPDSGTATPAVGPDGDVFFGVLEHNFASNHDRGWMLHFSGDLTASKVPGAFGWDDTASIVPATMVPSYLGSSSYLLMTKYNNYAGEGGDGHNKIAVLDPHASMTDPISGVTVMNEVLTIEGATPDAEFDQSHPGAVREWCINTAAVDPATHSILANSEDGVLYRWDVTTNSFSQTIRLTSGLGEAYTPTVVGPDGTVYAVNNATLFAVGKLLTPPTANNDSFSTLENTPLTVGAPGVLANDVDPSQSGTMTAGLLTNTSHGTLAFADDGSFTYTPDNLYSGPDSFTYKATEQGIDSNVATVNLTVNPDNPPVATPDTYTTREQTALFVPALTGVLANDTKGGGPTLTANLAAGPQHGTLSLAADGSFTYTPSAQFFGADSFTYKDNDGILDGNTVTVTLNVTFVNQPPVVVGGSYQTPQDTVLSVPAPGVLTGATDPDQATNPAGAETISASVVTSPLHGSLSLTADGSFNYTPTGGYFGPDSFTFKANDGQLDSNVATVMLTVAFVNQPPVSMNDTFTTNENAPLVVSAATGVLANDTDTDRAINPSGPETLTAKLVRGPGHGTLSLAADGSFTYTPNRFYFGPDSFLYRANDGQLDGSLATVTLTVNFVNQPPASADDAYVTDENSPLTVDAATGVLANDNDPDQITNPNTPAGETITATVVSAPQHGTLSLAADGSFLYTPNQDYHGTDHFTYKANDGQLDGNIATVALDVNFINQPPRTNDDFYTTAENVPLSATAPGILANDTDAENDTLTPVLETGPAHGSLSLGSDGSFTYTPALNFFGRDQFTYHDSEGSGASKLVSKGTSTVFLTISFVNQTPVGVPDSYTAAANNVLRVTVDRGVLNNDTDVENDPLAAVLVAGPAHGSLVLNIDGSFLYAPAPGFTGTDAFTYRADEGGGRFSDVTPATITVMTVNQPPVAAGVSLQAVSGVPIGGVPIATFTDPDTNEGASNFTAIVDFGDGSAPVPAMIVADSAGFHVMADHVYTNTTGGALTRTATITVTEPGVGMSRATTTVAVTPAAMNLGGSLTGAGAAPGGFTDTRTPSFGGTAPTGSTIRVTAQPAGGGAALSLGQVVADASGHWQLTSTALPDGMYTVSAAAVTASGATIQTAPLGTVVVDTTGPRVTAASYDSHSGRLTLTFQDDRSGLDTRALQSISAYAVDRLLAHGKQQAVPITSVVVSPAGPTAPEQVVLTLGGRRRGRSSIVVTVSSAVVGDLAGNHLDGEFAGTLPSGDDHPGGDLRARFDIGKRGAGAARPFAAALGIKVHTPEIRHPVGPRARRGR